MGRLTVVQALPSLDSGGVERGTLEVGQFLAQQGHRSVVVSGGGRLVETLTAQGSEHLCLPIGRKSVLTLRHVLRLRRFLLSERVDILHARSRFPAWICYLTLKTIPRELRPGFVTTVHGQYSVNPYSAIMTKGETVIVISEMIRDYVLRHYSGRSENLQLNYRGVDPAQFPFRYKPDAAWRKAWYQSFPQTRDRLLLCLPARVTRWKGQEQFIELIAALKAQDVAVHGLIVGETKAGKERYLSELTDMVAALGLQADITFTGHRPDVREIMAMSDIVYSMSGQPEAFGRTPLEALNLGRPVIAYDHGGVAEQLECLLPEGLVPLNDTKALRDKSLAWLQAPPKVKRVRSFTLENMLHTTLQVYQNLAAHKRNA